MSDFAANAERFSGFADVYDRYRPQPPEVLAALLIQFAQVARPALVVDLGSGTGLSTRFWAERADAVIGVEPSADMRRVAEQHAPAQVSYRAGLSHATGLPAACADVVTCSQALHWMEPLGTFREAQRILRPGGVFAAYDCDWPPTTSHWEADAAYRACFAQADAIEQRGGYAKAVQRWEKKDHLARMNQSGCFRYTTELVLHHIEPGNAERLVGVARSQGGIATLLKNGISEAEIGLIELAAVADRVLGPQPQPWYFGYRVRLAVV